LTISNVTAQEAATAAAAERTVAAACVAQAERSAGRAQAGGGIKISGLPANLARLNATYAPTGAQVAGYPSLSAGLRKHIFRHPEDDMWTISGEPFDPAKRVAWAYIPAKGGPVPTGARTWRVYDGAKHVDGEVTATSTPPDASYTDGDWT
jgi:hypothetical protein